MSLRLNIGGRSFYFAEHNVRRFSDSRLARLLDLSHEQKLQYCDEYFPTSDEYFFDRSSTLFESIAQIYRTGNLTSRIKTCCDDALESELNFWELKLEFNSHQCTNDNSENKSVFLPMDEVTVSKDDDDDYVPDDKYTCKCCIPVRRRLWKFLEDPFSSFLALIYAGLTILFVLITIAVLMVDSLPEFRYGQCPVQTNDNNSSNGSITTTVPCIPQSAVLDLLDCICVAWFTMDLILRLMATPQLWAFIRNPLNIIDFCALVPFYVELAIDISGTTDSSGTSTNIRRALMALRAFRIGRVVQLARYSDGLQALATALRRSVKELALMFMFLAILVTFLSTIVFYLESDVPGTNFTSIPATGWWALITVTTIGYGDMVPTTIAGKIVGSCAALLGIVVLAFPVSVIVDNCRKAYDEMIARKQRKAARNWKSMLTAITVNKLKKLANNARPKVAPVDVHVDLSK